MAYAQYEREIEGVTKFTDSDNLIAMGINLTYNAVSFYLHLWLQGRLCSMDYFQYYNLCYDYDEYYWLIYD